MIRSLGIISIWFFGLVFLCAGININEPYLISLRGLGAAVLCMTSVVVFIVLIKQGYWNRRGVAKRLLILLWCLPSLSILYAHASFEFRKRNVLQTDVARAHILGQHFVVGYSSFDEVVPLVEKGLIGGVYIARHNIAGRAVEALKSVPFVAAVDGTARAIHLGGPAAEHSGQESGRLRAYSRTGIGGTWRES